MTNRERLQAAGILGPQQFSETQERAIEDLYQWEVDQLIKIKKKLESFPGYEASQPVQPGINPVPPPPAPLQEQKNN